MIKRCNLSLENEDKNQDSNMGLIAQEVERVFPFLVKENVYTTEPLLQIF